MYAGAVPEARSIVAELALLSAREFLDRELPAPDVYFEPGYGQAEQAAGAGTWHVICSEDGTWLLPLHLTQDDLAIDASSPYGYSGVYADERISAAEHMRLWDAALGLLRDHGVVSLFLRQSPLLRDPFVEQPGLAVVRNHLTLTVDTTSASHAWARMEGRSRTSIRRAEREGFKSTFRGATSEDLTTGSAFRSLYEEGMVRRGASSRYFFPDAYYEHLHAALGRRLLISEVIDPDHNVVASALFMRSQRTLHYHLSGTDPTAGRSGATNLLLWTAIQAASEMQSGNLHLGGGLRNDDSLFKFKRSLGGYPMGFNAFGVIVNPERFELLSARANAARPAHEGRSEFFPPYRSAE